MFHHYARTLFEHQPPKGGPGLTDGQLVELGQNIGITTPEYPEAICKGVYLAGRRSSPSMRSRAALLGRQASLFVAFRSPPARAPFSPPSIGCSPEPTDLRPASGFTGPLPTAHVPPRGPNPQALAR